MKEHRRSDSNELRRLSSHYSAWSRQHDSSLQAALIAGLVVVDANVLLALYEVAPSAREEVLDVLTSLGDRLWVPHQVAIELVGIAKEW